MSTINRAAGALAITLGLVAGLTLTRAHTQSLAAPTYTEAQAKRGQEIYARNCLSCHGDQLDNGSFGAQLAGPVFVQRWGGKALDQPFAIMTATMPPDTPGTLGAAAYADVMAFILRENGSAPSATELPFDIAKLKAMAAPK